MSREGKTSHKLSPLLGESAAIEQLRDFIVGVSLLNRPVVLFGDEGTGKELAARKIHAVGRTAHAPFEIADCTQLTERELEERLFACEDATIRAGLLQRDDSATVYLAHIEHASPWLLRELLRFLLDDRQGLEATPRLVFGSEFSYEELIGGDVLDLAFIDAISQIRVTIPPLRERVEDIPILCHYQMWLHTDSTELDERWEDFKENVLPGLMHYPWPGNVNELNALIHEFCTGVVDYDVEYESEVCRESISDPAAFLAGEFERCHAELIETLHIEQALGRVDMVLLPETDREYDDYVN